MRLVMNVVCTCNLTSKDAEKIESGDMEVDDLDFEYYLEKALKDVDDAWIVD